MGKENPHIPTRMCVICRKRAPKKNMLRFTRAFEGADPVPDQKQKAVGRGVYVCEQARCQEAFSHRYAKNKVKGQEI